MRHLRKVWILNAGGWGWWLPGVPFTDMAHYSWVLLKLIGWDKLQITVHLCRCESRMLEGRGGFLLFCCIVVGWRRQRTYYWLLLLFDSELCVVVSERCFLGSEGRLPSGAFFFTILVTINQKVYSVLCVSPAQCVKRQKLVFLTISFSRLFKGKMDLDWIKNQSKVNLTNQKTSFLKVSHVREGTLRWRSWY